TLYTSLLHPPSPTATPPLSLHDALPISAGAPGPAPDLRGSAAILGLPVAVPLDAGGQLPHPLRGRGARPPRPHEHEEGAGLGGRSEEHTSELQSLAYLVCRLLLEKKKNK